ncbi:MAG: 5,10-methylenetetrahydrofolate reductase [Pyrobaculum sp.]
MEYIAEVAPLLDKDKLLKKLAALRRYVSWVDIPDAPGGKPSAHAIAVGALAKQQGLEPLVHLRLLDVNKTGFKSLLGAAKLLDISHVVVLQGDPPVEGTPVYEVTTEEAVSVAKQMGFKVGALLSLRRDYWKRLEIGADFYLALHFNDVSQLKDMPRNVYPYLIVETEKNAELLKKLRQTAVRPGEALKLLDQLEGFTEAVVVSVPGDFDTLLEILRVKTRRS